VSVLLVGGCGKIGTRYQAVLKYLKVPYHIFDPNFGHNNTHAGEFDHAIIATPTGTHIGYCDEFGRLGIPFLCEKPVSKDLESIKPLIKYNGYVVNNYAFSFGEFATDSCKIRWNYFNHGSDDLETDCCQLLMLDRHAVLLDNSPVWDCWNGDSRLSYGDLEYGYVEMIENFLGSKKLLWDMQDGYDMTLRILERKEKKCLAA
jgi:hypothetical protein